MVLTLCDGHNGWQSLSAHRHASLMESIAIRCCIRCAASQIIGRDCYDIDIALDNIMGREFAEKVNAYLHEHGQEARGVGVIQK